MEGAIEKIRPALSPHYEIILKHLEDYMKFLDQLLDDPAKELSDEEKTRLQLDDLYGKFSSIADKVNDLTFQAVNLV